MQEQIENLLSELERQSSRAGRLAVLERELKVSEVYDYQDLVTQNKYDTAVVAKAIRERALDLSDRLGTGTGEAPTEILAGLLFYSTVLAKSFGATLEDLIKISTRQLKSKEGAGNGAA